MDRAGAETMIMNLYREIDHSRYQFDFVYFTDDSCDFDEEINSLGGVIYKIPTKNLFKRFWLLNRLAADNSWHAVHVHTLFSGSLHLLSVKLAGATIRVAHAHSAGDSNNKSYLRGIYQRFSKWLYRRVATDYLACGEAAATFLFPKESNVIILPNAIDLKKFIQARKACLRQELNLRNGQIIILHLARFTPVKNHRFSLKIAADLKSLGIEFKFLLTGIGPELNRIKQLVEKNNLSKEIEFLGARSDIANLMKSSDVLILPSFYEGFPVVLVEAQASGLPSVVSTRISPEVDMGMGLVDFVDLDDPVRHWVDRIIDRANCDAAIVAEQRFNILSSRGFSSQKIAEKLMMLYD
tara:strand:+ start:15962 stop:17020 length:1059 start_codon:yes stop_codon:yes gene_type:complete